MIEHRRTGERFQGADRAREGSIECERVDARRLEQPALAERAVVHDGAPHEDTCQQRARQHGS